MPNELATFIARLGIDWQSWHSFIEEAAVSVAILAFGFYLLLYLSVTFLVWRRGAPWTRAQLLEYVLLSSFGSMFVASFCFALVALLWPAMQIMGSSHEFRESVVSFLSFNYLTLSSVAVVLVLIVTLLVWNKASQLRLGSIIASALDMWWVEAWLETPQTDGSNLQPGSTKPDSPRHRGRVGKGFHRLGVAVGVLLGLAPAALVVLQGEVAWGIGTGVVLFLIIYGFFRLLGWIVNGFFSGAR